MKDKLQKAQELYFLSLDGPQAYELSEYGKTYVKDWDKCKSGVQSTAARIGDDEKQVHGESEICDIHAHAEVVDWVGWKLQFLGKHFSNCAFSVLIVPFCLDRASAHGANHGW